MTSKADIFHHANLAMDEILGDMQQRQILAAAPPALHPAIKQILTIAEIDDRASRRAAFPIGT